MTEHAESTRDNIEHAAELARVAICNALPLKGDGVPYTGELRREAVRELARGFGMECKDDEDVQIDRALRELGIEI